MDNCLKFAVSIPNIPTWVLLPNHSEDMVRDLAVNQPSYNYFFVRMTTDIFEDEDADVETGPSHHKKEWAQDFFKDTISIPCPREDCEAGVDVLCDTGAIWVHIERIGEYYDSREKQAV